MEVPQESVKGAVLYLIYTYDLPLAKNVHMVTFADDSAVLASHENPANAFNMLQQSLVAARLVHQSK